MPWLSVFIIIQLCERVPACVSACVRPCMLVLEPTRLMAYAGCVKQCVLANHAIPSKTQLPLFIITILIWQSGRSGMNEGNIWNAVKHEEFAIRHRRAKFCPQESD